MTNHLKESLDPRHYISRFPLDLKIKYIPQGMQAENLTLTLVTNGFPVLSQKYSDHEYDRDFEKFFSQEYINASNDAGEHRRTLTGNYLIISNPSFQKTSSSQNMGGELKFCLKIQL